MKIAELNTKVFVIAPSLLRWGLEKVLEAADPGMQLTGTAETVRDAQSQLEELRPHVLVIDYENHIEFVQVKTLLNQLEMRLLVIASQDSRQVNGALMAGARGVISVNLAPADFLKSIRKVHEGELWIDRGSHNCLLERAAQDSARPGVGPDHSRIKRLTAREREIIVALSTDAAAPGKVIASRMSISTHTLRNHLTSIYDKLNMRNRRELYDYVGKHGLMDRSKSATF